MPGVTAVVVCAYNLASEEHVRGRNGKILGVESPKPYGLHPRATKEERRREEESFFREREEPSLSLGAERVDNNLMSVWPLYCHRKDANLDQLLRGG